MCAFVFIVFEYMWFRPLFGANAPTIVGPEPSHTFRCSTTMAKQPGFHNRQHHITLKIRTLLVFLTNNPSEYDKIAPKIEYWIEYALRERLTTVDELVEGVSYAAWDQGGSYTSIVRFLKEFYDAPHRSEQTRSFVDKLCEYVLRWFATAAAEDSYSGNIHSLASGGGSGFMRAASFVGHLIEGSLLSHELVRQHLAKSLIAHYDQNYYRANAIYQLFLAAGNTLLRGLIDPEDAQIYFEILNTQMSAGSIEGSDPGKLQVRNTTILEHHRDITCSARNSARYMPRGWSGGMKTKEMPRRRK